MKKSQVVFLAIIALVLGYFLASVLFFGLNHSFKKLPKLWYVGLTFDMLINGWSKAYLSYFLANFISFTLAFYCHYCQKNKVCTAMHDLQTLAILKKWIYMAMA